MLAEEVDERFTEEPCCSEECIKEVRAIIQVEYARIGCAHPRVREARDGHSEAPSPRMTITMLGATAPRNHMCNGRGRRISAEGL